MNEFYYSECVKLLKCFYYKDVFKKHSRVGHTFHAKQHNPLSVCIVSAFNFGVIKDMVAMRCRFYDNYIQNSTW